MACTITILSVTGETYPNSSSLKSITVTGTASGCQKVKVGIECIDGQIVEHDDIPVTPPPPQTVGQWQTTFTDEEIKIAGCKDCGNLITVMAVCSVQDPPSPEGCNFTWGPAEIPCDTLCPVIDSIEADIPSCEQVLAVGGVWNVTFTVQITGTNVTAALWDFGDDTTQYGPPPQNGVPTPPHAYKCAGNYHVILTIFSDCQPYYSYPKTVELTIPPCGCPNIEDISAKAEDNNPCHWTFQAKIAGPFLDCIDKYLWNYGDGAQEYRTQDADHTYSQDGNYTVTLTLEGGIGQVGGGPCYATKPIAVIGCSGSDNGGHPCPWWNPFCHGWNLCAALLALALATIASAMLLFILAGCTGSAGGYEAAVVASVLSFAELTLWYLLCSRVNKVDFCHTLKSVMSIVSVIIGVQTTVGIFLYILGNAGCGIGLALTWGYYGTVLAYLQWIRIWAGCP